MTTRQERKLSMALTVLDFVDSTQATVLAVIPKFQDTIELLRTEVGFVQLIREQQELNRSGTTQAKNILKSSLIGLVLDVARKATAYAINEGDQVLLQEVRYPKSTLEKSADTILRDRAQVVHDRAKAHLTALKLYGIDADSLTVLQDAITAFQASIPKPRSGVVTKKAATTDLVIRFKNMDALLERMDGLVEVVRDTETDFYGRYGSSRELTNMGSRVMSVRGIVTNAEGLPLANVTVSIDGQDMVLHTTDKGRFQLQSLAEGTYTFRFAKEGYVPAKELVPVTAGERREIGVVMVEVE
jgi:carboxypeptidase family protein